MAALKDGRPRILTQSVASHLYANTDVAGVNFASRHGDDLELWAIFERHDEHAVSRYLASLKTYQLSPDHPELLAVLAFHGLRWREG